MLDRVQHDGKLITVENIRSRVQVCIFYLRHTGGLQYPVKKVKTIYPLDAGIHQHRESKITYNLLIIKQVF